MTTTNKKQMPTAGQFKAWCEEHRALAFAVVEARAAAESTRAKVDEYIRPIFDGFGFVYRDDLTARRGGEELAGKPIPSPKELYLCDDEERVTEYFAACDAEHRRQGYDLPQNHCPALVAEHLVVKAENALMEAANPLLGIESNPHGEDRAQYLKLLVGACLTGDEDARRWTEAKRAEASALAGRV